MNYTSADFQQGVDGQWYQRQGASGSPGSGVGNAAKRIYERRKDFLSVILQILFCILLLGSLATVFILNLQPWLMLSSIFEDAVIPSGLLGFVSAVPRKLFVRMAVIGGLLLLYGMSTKKRKGWAVSTGSLFFLAIAIILTLRMTFTHLSLCFAFFGWAIVQGSQILTLLSTNKVFKWMTQSSENKLVNSLMSDRIWLLSLLAWAFEFFITIICYTPYEGGFAAFWEDLWMRFGDASKIDFLAVAQVLATVGLFEVVVWIGAIVFFALFYVKKSAKQSYV